MIPVDDNSVDLGGETRTTSLGNKTPYTVRPCGNGEQKENSHYAEAGDVDDNSDEFDNKEDDHCHWQ